MIKSNLTLLLITLYLGLATISLVIIDQSLVGIIEDWRLISLSADSKENLGSIDEEITALNNDINQAQLQLNQLSSRRYAYLEDIKRLHSSYRLQLVEMERVTRTEAEEDNLLKYILVLEGSIKNLVRFLNELEREFVIHSEGITLTSASEDGSKVRLNISIIVSVI